MNFKDLDALRREVAALRKEHVRSLISYHLPGEVGGFRHKYLDKGKGEFSRASTATCILSLTTTGNWGKGYPWQGQAGKLAEAMLKRKWSSSGLYENNPFTVAFILEAVTALGELKGETTVDEEAEKRIGKAVKLLTEALTDPNKPVPDSVGAAGLKEYPLSTYITQLVVRTLIRREKFNADLRQMVTKWAWRHIEHELVLAFTGSKTADAYSLAYAVMVFASAQSSKETPDQKHTLRKAVAAVFDAQLPDGSWPRSQPLFHYPDIGNAYCYEYEMLTQLLQQRSLQPLLLMHLDKLALSARRLRDTSYQLDNGGLAWASGHHPQEPGPESWSTASVYHFLYEFDRLLAEAVRRTVFEYVGAEYRSPGRPSATIEQFADGFLDSDLFVEKDKDPVSLTSVLFNKFVEPLAKNANQIELGRDLPKSVAISAIFFGPPGTSKTQLANKIANFLNWPLLPLDPSYLVKRGQDKIQAETNRLFSMLAALERVVVLFDELGAIPLLSLKPGLSSSRPEKRSLTPSGP